MIGENIKELRSSNDMTQKELADLLSLTPKMISFYEHNERTPPADIIKKICAIYHVSADYLLDIDVSGTQKSADPPFLLDAREKALIANYRQLDDNGKTGVDHYIKFSLSEASTENVKEA